MNYPTLLNLGQVWHATRRDRSWCIATLRTALEGGETPRGYLAPGVYNGGFIKVTECTERTPDGHIGNAIIRENNRRPNEKLTLLSPAEFRALYVIHRHYETTYD